MAWSGSAIFQQALLNPIGRGVAGTTGYPTSYSTMGLLGDVVNCALYLTGATPDKTVAVASSGYNTGQWVTGNEAPTAGNYTQGGTALSGLTWALDTGSSSIVFHANNPQWTSATISSVFGCLVYDNTITGGTVAKQGMCYNYFGGTQSVSGGTFTVIWATVGATTGIFNITV